MNEERQIIIHFNNGETLKVTLPIQIKNSVAALMEVMKRLLESEKLVISTEDKTIIVPWSSVKHLETQPPVEGLPLGSIQKARIVE